LTTEHVVQKPRSKKKKSFSVFPTSIKRDPDACDGKVVRFENRPDDAQAWAAGWTSESDSPAIAISTPSSLAYAFAVVNELSATRGIDVIASSRIGESTAIGCLEVLPDGWHILVDSPDDEGAPFAPPLLVA
jgi:hypothetical protein